MDSVERALARVDREKAAARFRDDSEPLFLDGVLPPAVLDALLLELEHLKPRLHRDYVPWIRKGGNVGYRTLRRHAPTMVQLYRSRALIDLVSQFAGRPVHLKSDADDHVCAVYGYTRRGDHMGFHFDTCGCEPGASYTVLIGLVNRSSQRLRCQVQGKNGEVTREVELATSAGSMTVFCGSKVRHAVTRLGTGEERFVLSLGYTTDVSMSRPIRFKENLKDASLFGISALFQRNYDHARSRFDHMENQPAYVLITGASSGIGEAVAYEYARRGAHLALFARREERLRAVASRCEQLGAPSTLVLPGDTTVPMQVNDAASVLAATWPRVDRALLAAGGISQEDVDREASHLVCECCGSVAHSVTGFSARSVTDVMNLNFHGVVNWVEPLLARMRTQGSGSIAVTGSLAADRGLPRTAAYAASKGAVRTLFDALRPAATNAGIHLCLIEPGYVDSQLTAPRHFRQLFLRSAEEAATRFVDGIEAREPTIRYPWQMSVLSRARALVPRAIFDRWAASPWPARLGVDV